MFLVILYLITGMTIWSYLIWLTKRLGLYNFYLQNFIDSIKEGIPLDKHISDREAEAALFIISSLVFIVGWPIILLQTLDK